MAVIGVLTCEILELEFAWLLARDPSLARVSLLDDEYSKRLAGAYRDFGGSELVQIKGVEDFIPLDTDQTEVLIGVLEVGLHTRIKLIQDALQEATLRMGPKVDLLVLGYGLCGNALKDHEELLAEVGVPVLLPMDEDHPVDDCVGLLIGGREAYYQEQCKEAGTFFGIPGWMHHWRPMMVNNLGGLDITKRMFEAYTRLLLLELPVMELSAMQPEADSFNQVFNLRTESQPGTMSILEQTWRQAQDMAKRCKPSPTQKQALGA